METYSKPKEVEAGMNIILDPRSIPSEHVDPEVASVRVASGS